MITIHEPNEDGYIEVWTNPEKWPDKAGRCIGDSKDRKEAIIQAIRELEDDMEQLRGL